MAMCIEAAGCCLATQKQDMKEGKGGGETARMWGGREQWSPHVYMLRCAEHSMLGRAKCAELELRASLEVCKLELTRCTEYVCSTSQCLLAIDAGGERGAGLWRCHGPKRAVPHHRQALSIHQSRRRCHLLCCRPRCRCSRWGRTWAVRWGVQGGRRSQRCTPQRYPLQDIMFTAPHQGIV